MMGKGKSVIVWAVVLAGAVGLGIPLLGTQLAAWPIGLAVLGIGLIGWLRKPILFFAVSGLLYVLLQEVGQNINLGSVAGIDINAVQLYVVGVALLMCLRVLMASYTAPRPINRVLVVHLIHVAMAVLLLFRSPQPGMAVSGTMRLVACLVALWAGYYCVRSIADLRTASVVVEVAGVAVAVLGLVEYQLSRGTFEAIRKGSVRVGSLLGEPSGAGNVMTITLPGAWGRFVESRGTLRGWVAIGELLAVGVGLFSTFTRRAIQTAFLFLFFSWRGLDRGRGWQRRLATGFVAIVVMLVVGYAGYRLVGESAVEQRLQDLPGVGNVKITDSGFGSSRGMIWRAVLKGIAESGVVDLVVGHGTESVPFCVQRYAGVFKNAHNSYLEMLYDMGIIGLVLYILTIGITWRELQAVARRSSGYLGLAAASWALYWIIYHMTIEMFGSSVLRIEARWFMMFMSGIILGLSAARRDSRNEKARGE